LCLYCTNIQKWYKFHIVHR